MYSGFNVDLRGITIPEFYLVRGRALYEANQETVRAKISSFINPRGKIDAGQLQAEWFPSVEADVFISHSHNDLDQALIFSGWLLDQGITTFVDSCVWGNASQLLKEIDKIYTWQPTRGVYDYNLRNFSTSHVHMLLSVALTKIIDTCECLFFLNTPNAIRSEEVVAETASPWLYHELTIASFIRRKELSDYRSYADFQKGLSVNEGLEMAFPVNLEDLIELDANDIVAWEEKLTGMEPYPLDTLYKYVSKRRKLKTL